MKYIHWNSYHEQIQLILIHRKFIASWKKKIKTACSQCLYLFYNASSLTSAPTGPPLNLAVHSINSTSLTLSWESPSLTHQNAAPLNYTVTCMPPATSGLSPLVSVFMTAGTHTLNGLTPATLYGCVVLATNLYGNSPPVNISATTKDGGMCMWWHFSELMYLATTCLFPILRPEAP